MPRRRPRHLVLPFVALLAPWAGPGRAAAAGCRERKPTTWDIEVAPASEPGERLIVTGRVLARAAHAPLPGVTVYVYHADATGEYNLAGHEKEPPRLCGILRTNGAGEFRIRTSMPGIHFEVWGPRVQRQMTFVNLVRKDVVMDTSRVLILPGSAPALREDIGGLTRPVYRGEGGVLRCVRDLVVDVR